ncbi:Hypothetical_protein [Hexamita inflata]|uniref:Hypothetical_protein n=1 Tax=Hexamita inflata TaxID=28002 RepID=A0AA86PCR5_9EUKA|nr:Hypothetical protein HINF_LOCUS24051 [Hexamita inflata]
MLKQVYSEEQKRYQKELSTVLSKVKQLQHDEHLPKIQQKIQEIDIEDVQFKRKVQIFLQFLSNLQIKGTASEKLYQCLFLSLQSIANKELFRIAKLALQNQVSSPQSLQLSQTQLQLTKRSPIPSDQSFLESPELFKQKEKLRIAEVQSVLNLFSEELLSSPQVSRIEDQRKEDLMALVDEYYKKEI